MDYFWLVAPLAERDGSSNRVGENNEQARCRKREVSRVWSGTGMKGRGKREIPEKTRRQAASSGMIPTCENMGGARPGNEPGSPWWEGGRLNHSDTAAPGVKESLRFGNPERKSWSVQLRTQEREEYPARHPQTPGAVNMERGRNGEEGETGDPREDPPTNGIVRHDSHLRKSGDPAGDRTRFALVGRRAC
ncbi:hypothetical protein PR048_031315 [Dryococelus australis]|uniref:Uncharacterized protein n=1 Tax=Dryococelus australis TaxID=614101 RepID=A0ABQ9G5M4_9NEOP|nr:hypothetical protein PR048_031315 [Dryococelus australis]